MSTTIPAIRLRELYEEALAEERFEALVIRIVAFRAYALALRDAQAMESLHDIDAFDAALVERFTAASGNPGGLKAFLPPQ